MLVTPKALPFFESVSTGEQGHNNDYIYRGMCRVIEKSLEHLSGVVMDDTAANKAA